MKFSLLILLTASLTAPLVRGQKKFDVLVVTEQTAAAATLSPAGPAEPAYYIAFDAGLIESGFPVAGEPAPPAGLMARLLVDALATRHFHAATPGHDPSVVLIFHWGVLRPESNAPERRMSSALTPNLRARLSLVENDKTIRMIQDGLLTVVTPVRNIDLPRKEEAMDRASVDRYFVIVSAYDASSFHRRTPSIVWRTILSTETTTGAMSEVLPALVTAGQSYFGAPPADPHTFTAEFTSRTPNAADTAPSPFAEATASALLSEASAVYRIIWQERVRFSGNRHLRPLPRPGQPDREPAAAQIPPVLRQRITDYLAEKNALQTALSQKIREHPTGAENKRTVAAFRAEHARQIASLVQQRETIRGELGRISAADSPTSDQALDALLRQFSGDVRQIDPEPFLTDQ